MPRGASSPVHDERDEGRTDVLLDSVEPGVMSLKVVEGWSGVLGIAKSAGDPLENRDLRTLRADAGLPNADPGLLVGVVESPARVVIEEVE